jgi:ABC-2 type transport system permease protein
MPSATSTPWSSSLAREWARLRADRWDLAMLGWIPLVLYLLTWWIFSAGIARELPLAVRDLDNSAQSRSLLRMLDQSPGLRPVLAASDAEALGALRAGRVFGILSMPAHMGEQLARGEHVTLGWAYNAQYPSHTGAMTRDVRAVVATLSAGAELQGRAKRGSAGVQAMQQLEPVATRPVGLFNESGSIVPSLALPAVWSLLHIFVALAALTAVGRELRNATVPEWLAAADGRLGPALLAKLAIPFGVFVLQGALLTLAFGALLGWPVLGSFLAMALGTVLLVTAYLALGACLVAWSASLRAALSACAFITAPAFAFSGQGFPMQAMPLAARAWAEALPLTHFLSLVNNTWLAGAPLRYGLGALAALALFTTGFGIAAYLRLRTRGRRPDSWGHP